VPVGVSGPAQDCLAKGYQGPLGQFGSEVVRVLVGDHLTRIVLGSQHLTEELGGVQVAAGVVTSVRPPQPLAVDEVGAGQVHSQPGPASGPKLEPATGIIDYAHQRFVFRRRREQTQDGHSDQETVRGTPGAVAGGDSQRVALRIR
jgi:hypothetical protein